MQLYLRAIDALEGERFAQTLEAMAMAFRGDPADIADTVKTLLARH